MPGREEAVIARTPGASRSSGSGNGASKRPAPRPASRPAAKARPPAKAAGKAPPKPKPAAKSPAARKPAAVAKAAPKPAKTRTAPAPATPKKQAALTRPAPARKPRPAATPDVLRATLELITTSLADDKAEDIVVLDLAGKASFADRMVVATGLADRQLQAMATHLVEKLEGAGRRRIAIEGMGASDWVLIDAGDVVVHLFKPEARTAYALEKMWGEAFPGDQEAADQPG